MILVRLFPFSRALLIFVKKKTKIVCSLTHFDYVAQNTTASLSYSQLIFSYHNFQIIASTALLICNVLLKSFDRCIHHNPSQLQLYNVFISPRAIFSMYFGFPFIIIFNNCSSWFSTIFYVCSNSFQRKQGRYYLL